MTEQDLAERPLFPAPGDGIVARHGSAVFVGLGGGDDDVLDRLLDACRDAGDAVASGRQLARTIAGILVQAAPDSVPSFCAFAPTDTGLAAIVCGDAELLVEGGNGEVLLAGRDAATWVDRVIGGPIGRVLARPTGVELPEASGRFQLRNGVVQGGGATLLASTDGQPSSRPRATGGGRGGAAAVAAAVAARPTDAEEAPGRHDGDPRRPADDAAPPADRAEDVARQQAEAEAEAAQRAEAEAAARQQAEAATQRRAAEEAASRQQAEAEAQQRAAQEQAARQQAEAEAQQRAAQEEAARQQAEAQRQQAEAEAQRQRAAAEEAARQEAARQQGEAEAQQRAAEEEAARQQAEAQRQQAEAQQRAAQEEAARQQAEAQRQQAEAEAQRQRAAQEEAARRQAEAEAQQRAAAEEAARQRAVEEEARRRIEEQSSQVPPVGAQSQQGPPAAEGGFQSILLADFDDEPTESRTPLPLAGQAPGPGQAAADDLPDDMPPQVEVDGITCARGHFNNPNSLYCSVCGLSMVQQTSYLVKGVRPPLGVFVFDDGTTFTVDSDYVIGREPEGDPRVVSGDARPMAIPDPERAISRVHAEIHLKGWDVIVEDRGSANGTYILPPGGTEWLRLPSDTTASVPTGARVLVGRRHFIFDSHHVA